MSDKKFPWGCVLGGCAIVVVLVIVSIGGAGYFGVKKAKQFAEDIKDPAVRAKKVQKILGAEQLPEGYYPVIGMSVPFVIDFALLSDRQSHDDGEPDGPREKGFLFISVLSSEEQRREVDDFLEGRRSDTSFLKQQNIEFDVHDELGRGSFEQEFQSIKWVSYRGEIEISDSKTDGITSVMMIKCSEESKRIRMGILFGPDPNPELEVSEFNPTGTPADEAMMDAFMSHLRLCEK
jgi:hypothetical protein